MTDQASSIFQSSIIKVSFIILAAAVFLTALFFLPLSAPPPTDTALESFTVHLDQRVPRLLQRYRIPGVSLALVADGELVWSGAYGYADLETGREIRPDTPCRVQSISKSVTAWGVMKLAEDGKINLDEPLGSYLHSWQLPDTQYSEEQITIRQLLTQTSGMPLGTIGIHYLPDEPKPSLRENLSQEARLMKEPGGSFAYSNPGFNLLELLIEDVTGREFAEYMETEVLNPLGMKQASFELKESWQDQVPLAYDSRGTGIPVYLYPEKAAGGLFANAEEIGLFLTAGMTKGINPGADVIRKESLQLMYTPEADLTGYYRLVTDSYGLGHFLETLDSGETAVWHGGQGHGWMTHFHSIPERGDGIVILTNSQRSWPFFAHLLQDWADWAGVSHPGMVLILKATRVMWGILVLLAVTVLRTGWIQAAGFLKGDRKYKPFNSQKVLQRSAAGAVGLTALIYLGLELTRGYSFLGSIFPAVYPWLIIFLTLLAVQLLICALFPDN